MRFRVLSGLFLLAACFEAAAGDLYATIDRLRAGGGNCRTAENLPRLKPHGALERVARDLARGNELKRSLQAAGYRETRSSAFSITGDGVGAQAAEILARSTYCPRLQDAGLTEVGVYLDARQVWVVMAAPFAPSVRMSVQAAGERVLDLVNQARATRRTCGNRVFKAARPVRWNDALAESSQRHSEDMARNNYFNHIGRDGSTAAQRVERAGYDYRVTGENIAGGQLNPEDAVATWIKSPTHCANLMNPVFTEMGAGFAVDRASAMGVYWTQAFGAPQR